MLLAHRPDLVAEAGIDLAPVETWDEFFEALRPLMKDTNGDGRPKRYLPVRCGVRCILCEWPPASAMFRGSRYDLKGIEFNDVTKGKIAKA